MIELNRAQTLALGGGVPQSSVEHRADAAADRNHDDTDMNDVEGREQDENTEQARATRGHRRARSAAAPSQWSDLNLNELKAFIRHQQTISSTLRLTKPKGSELPQKIFLISQLQNFDFAAYWPIAPLPTAPLVLPLLDASSEFDKGESEVANDITSPYLYQGEATTILAIGSAASLSLVIETDLDDDLEDIGNMEDEQAIEEGDEDEKIIQNIVEEGSEKSIHLNINVGNHKRSLISSPILDHRSDCLSPLYQRSCQRT